MISTTSALMSRRSQITSVSISTPWPSTQSQIINCFWPGTSCRAVPARYRQDPGFSSNHRCFCPKTGDTERATFVRPGPLEFRSRFARRLIDSPVLRRVLPRRSPASNWPAELDSRAIAIRRGSADDAHAFALFSALVYRGSSDVWLSSLAELAPPGVAESSPAIRRA